MPLNLRRQQYVLQQIKIGIFSDDLSVPKVRILLSCSLLSETNSSVNPGAPPHKQGSQEFEVRHLPVYSFDYRKYLSCREINEPRVLSRLNFSIWYMGFHNLVDERRASRTDPNASKSPNSIFASSRTN